MVSTVTHEGELCRIGTHSSNEVVLEDPAVSRFHCRISREEAKDTPYEKDFSKLDKDGDGKLSQSELTPAPAAGSSAGATGGSAAPKKQ